MTRHTLLKRGALFPKHGDDPCGTRRLSIDRAQSKRRTQQHGRATRSRPVHRDEPREIPFGWKRTGRPVHHTYSDYWTNAVLRTNPSL